MCGTRSRSDICAQVAWRWCGSWGKWRGSSKSWPGGVLYGEPGGAVHGDCLWHQGGGCPSWGRSSKERTHVAAEGQVVFQVWVQRQTIKAKLRKLKRTRTLHNNMYAHKRKLPRLRWVLPVKRDEAPDCSNFMLCWHGLVNTSIELFSLSNNHYLPVIIV